MSKKIGRPKAENPMKIFRTIRLDVETERRLQEYCERNHVSKGEAIRRGIYLLSEKK